MKYFDSDRLFASLRSHHFVCKTLEPFLDKDDMQTMPYDIKWWLRHFRQVRSTCGTCTFMPRRHSPISDWRDSTHAIADRVVTILVTFAETLARFLSSSCVPAIAKFVVQQRWHQRQEECRYRGWCRCQAPCWCSCGRRSVGVRVNSSSTFCTKGGCSGAAAVGG